LRKALDDLPGSQTIRSQEPRELAFAEHPLLPGFDRQVDV